MHVNSFSQPTLRNVSLIAILSLMALPVTACKAEEEKSVFTDPSIEQVCSNYNSENNADMSVYSGEVYEVRLGHLNYDAGCTAEMNNQQCAEWKKEHKKNKETQVTIYFHPLSNPKDNYAGVTDWTTFEEVQEKDNFFKEGFSYEFCGKPSPDRSFVDTRPNFQERVVIEKSTIRKIREN